MFALITWIVSILGIYGSLKLPMFASSGGKFNFGPGFMPFVFCTILFIFSAFFFFSDRDQPRLNWHTLFDQYALQGWKYYLLNFGMLLLVFLVGMVPAMAVFGISSQLILKRQKLLWALLFNAIWVGMLYVIFVILLKVPFENGLLFN